MDRIVAQCVMGETVVETDDCNGDDNYWLARPSLDKDDWPGLPRYSKEMDAAWEVVAHFCAREATVTVEQGHHEGSSWAGAAIRFHGYRSFQDQTFIADANTVPEAICLAALKAAGGPRSQG